MKDSTFTKAKVLCRELEVGVVFFSRPPSPTTNFQTNAFRPEINVEFCLYYFGSKRFYILAEVFYHKR